MANLDIDKAPLDSVMANLGNSFSSCGLAKILKEEWQVDIRLKAGANKEAAAISAHKLILASRSHVFKKMFELDEFKACNEVQTVTFSEMRQEELEAFVEFIYSFLSSDKLRKHFRSLYIAADKYEVSDLRYVCRNKLIRTMNTSNALDALELAQIPFDKALNNAAFEFISENLMTISNSATFKLFMGREPDLTVKLINAALKLPNPRPARVVKARFT